MTYPSHDYSGLENPSSDPFTEWFEDEYRKENQAQQPAKEQKPTPQAFGPELVEVVRKALEAKELLTSTGQYIGKKMQTKALYNVLVKRGYVLGMPKPEERFTAWFMENFTGDISGRALRNPASRGQEDEEIEFLSLIPAKK